MNGKSPEEKLLNLIKQGTNPAAAKNTPVQEEPVGTSFVDYSQKESLSGAVTFTDLCEPLGLFKIDSYQFNIIHKVLSIIIIILFGYAFYLFFNYFFIKQDVSLVKFEGKELIVKEDTDVLKTASLDYYLQVIGKRKLFKIYEPKKVTGAAPSQPSVTIDKKLASISLLGIIWDEGNAQAIVEDRKDKKTYYVYEGDSIGDIVVVKIEQGRAIFRYGDQEQELTI